MARRATNSDGSKVERRRNHRFAVHVPVEVSWRDPDNGVVKEQATARQVNANGGLLEMPRYPDMGSRVTIANLLSAESAEARVLATPGTREGVANGIIIELIVPSEAFWGIDLQAKRASVEVQRLEKALREAGIDLRMLNEFRDTAQYLHTISMTVKQIRECQIAERPDSDVIAALSADRLARTADLCVEVLADLNAGRIHADTKGLEEYCRSLEDTLSRLKPLLPQSETVALPSRRK
jgi:hypothetical protein